MKGVQVQNQPFFKVYACRVDIVDAVAVDQAAAAKRRRG